jgi:uncharacterized membrane protein YhaH (DUF805 family)
MLRAYFGGLATGCLPRLPFLGLWVLLLVLVFLYGSGIAFGIGVASPLIGGDLPAAQDSLRARVGQPGILLLGLVLLVLVFAQLNLVVKRFRDMGLPGGWTLLAAALISAGLWPGLGWPAVGGFNGLVVLGLLVIPSGGLGPKVAGEPVPLPAPESAEPAVEPGEGARPA